MKQWGRPVGGRAEQVVEEYVPRKGEKVKLKCHQGFTNLLYPWQDAEQEIINRTIAEYEDNIHWKLLYVKVRVVVIHRFWQYDAEFEIHLEATQVEPITLAIAIGIIILAGVIASWFAVLTWGTWKFIEGVGPIAGGLALIIIFILIFVFVGGFFKAGKGRVEVGRKGKLR